MRQSIKLTQTALAISAVFFSTSIATAQIPNFEILREITFNGGTITGIDIDDYGAVLAISNDTGRGFISLPNGVRQSAPIGFSPLALSSTGLAVGNAIVNGNQTGVLWRRALTGNSPNQLLPLLPYSDQAFGTSADAINRFGTAVGVTNLRALTGYLKATMWINGIPSQLDVPGECNEARAINDAGEIVGAYALPGEDCYPNHGFIMRDNTVSTIELPGFSYAYPIAISSDGTALGCAYNNHSGAGDQAFVHKNGITKSLGAFTYPSSCALAKSGDLVAVNSWGRQYEDEPSLINERTQERVILRDRVPGDLDIIQIIAMNDRNQLLISVRDIGKYPRTLVLAPVS